MVYGQREIPVFSVGKRGMGSRERPGKGEIRLTVS
jgi:hypothetical protein